MNIACWLDLSTEMPPLLWNRKMQLISLDKDYQQYHYISVCNLASKNFKAVEQF
jgi:hypothetical protein